MRKPGELISGSVDHEGNRTIPRINDHDLLVRDNELKIMEFRHSVEDYGRQLVEFYVIGNFGAERQLETDPSQLSIREVSVDLLSSREPLRAHQQ